MYRYADRKGRGGRFVLSGQDTMQQDISNTKNSSGTNVPLLSVYG